MVALKSTDKSILTPLVIKYFFSLPNLLVFSEIPFPVQALPPCKKKDLR